MTRQKLGRILAGMAAFGFIGTAILHYTGYDSIIQLAEKGPEELQVLVPALWLSFSINLIIPGTIVAVIAFRPSRLSRLILIILALCPISAAILQILFLGFIPPTAILFADGILAIVAAGILPS